MRLAYIVHVRPVRVSRRFTDVGHTAEVVARTNATHVVRRSATRSAWVSTEQCTVPSAASSAASAASASNDLLRCPRTCSSTPTPDPTHANSAANDSTRSQTWRNTPTSTPVTHALFSDSMLAPTVYYCPRKRRQYCFQRCRTVTNTYQ